MKKITLLTMAVISGIILMAAGCNHSPELTRPDTGGGYELNQ